MIPTNRSRLHFVLAAAVAIVTVLVGLTLPPPDANGLSWRYYTITDGTKLDRQVDAIIYRYPSRATIFPQRRIATSYSYYENPVGGLPCKVEVPYTFRSTCKGWQAVGPTGAYQIEMGVEVNWHGTGFKDEGWFGIEYRTYCDPVYAIGMTLDIIKCGLLSQTYSTVTLGLYYSTTTQAYGAYPTVTVWHRSYIVCSKDLGTCAEPFTVPAG